MLPISDSKFLLEYTIYDDPRPRWQRSLVGICFFLETEFCDFKGNQRKYRIAGESTPPVFSLFFFILF